MIPRFEIKDLQIIKQMNVPVSSLRRQINNLVQDSREIAAIVEQVDPETGTYRLVLTGRLDN